MLHLSQEIAKVSFVWRKIFRYKPLNGRTNMNGWKGNTQSGNERLPFEFVNIQNHTANANYKERKLYPFHVCTILALFWMRRVLYFFFLVLAFFLKVPVVHWAWWWFLCACWSVELLLSHTWSSSGLPSLHRRNHMHWWWWRRRRQKGGSLCISKMFAYTLTIIVIISNERNMHNILSPL